MLLTPSIRPSLFGTQLAWHSSNLQLEKIGPETAKQVGTGEELYDPDSGLRVYFPKGRQKAVFELKGCEELAQDDPPQYQQKFQSYRFRHETDPCRLPHLSIP